jgi:hypothetical protein
MGECETHLAFVIGRILTTDISTLKTEAACSFETVCPPAWLYGGVAPTSYVGYFLVRY